MFMIWKFQVEIVDRQTIHMPLGARIISAQVQGDTICLWAIVDPGSNPSPATIRIVGTGQQMPEVDMEHLGTVQMDQFVWHVFRERWHV